MVRDNRAAHTAPLPVPPDLDDPALPGVPANGHGEAVSIEMCLSSGLHCAKTIHCFEFGSPKDLM